MNWHAGVEVPEQLSLGYRISHDECRWYALYTCPRHEKYVQKQLTVRALESYLPLSRSLRRWNDREAWIDLPLFPGYLFVRMGLNARVRALSVPGVVRIVSFRGQPASLTEEEIQSI